jgi:predicted nucleotidyltransferase
MFDFTPHQKDIDRLCEKYGVANFAVFGSALRENFANDSDIDCVIEFVVKDENYFERYFDLKFELEDLFGRNVDLVVEKAIRNPYFKREMDETKKLVYAA